MMDAIDFLQKDYELKVNYLTGHLSRMWVRFNFFLSIESALLVFSFNKDSIQYTRYFVLTGLSLSILWYKFAAADNFLVEVYRRQVAHVFTLLQTSRADAFEVVGLDPSPDGYSYVSSVSNICFNPKTGQVEPIEQNIWQNVWQKGSRRLSVTELGVIFSFLFIILWIVRLIL